MVKCFIASIYLLESITWILTQILYCGQQEESADYSWSAVLYKLYSEVFPKSVHILGIPLLYQLIGNLRTTTKFTTTTTVDWEKTGTKTSVSAWKRKINDGEFFLLSDLSSGKTPAFRTKIIQLPTWMRWPSPSVCESLDFEKDTFRCDSCFPCKVYFLYIKDN